MSDYIKQLFEGAEGLSDEFKTQIQEAFEKAVSEKVTAELADERAKLDEEKQALAEEKETLEQNLVEKTESYLTDVVVPELVEKVQDQVSHAIKEWKETNKIALESGVKVELAESIIAGFKGLCESHKVEMPQDKRDLVEEADARANELETRLNAKIDEAIALGKQVTELSRENAIMSVCEDMTDTEVEKFRKVVESVEFTDADGYRAQIQELKESHFPADRGQEKETLVEDEAGAGQAKLDENMDPYYKRLIG